MSYERAALAAAVRPRHAGDIDARVRRRRWRCSAPPWPVPPTRRCSSYFDDAVPSPRSTAPATRSRPRWSPTASGAATGWPSTCRTSRSSCIAMVATWKAGGDRGLDQPDEQGARARATLLDDSGASVLVSPGVAVRRGRPRTSSPSATRRARGDHHERARLPGRRRAAAARRRSKRARPAGTLDLVELIDGPRRRAAAGRRRSRPTTSPSSPTRPARPAPPKGAMNTHAQRRVQLRRPTATGCR